MASEMIAGICRMVRANAMLEAAAMIKRMPAAIEAERTKSLAMALGVNSRKVTPPTSNSYTTAKADTSVDVATPEVTPLPIIATMIKATRAPPSKRNNGMRLGNATFGSTLRPKMTAMVARPMARNTAGTMPARNRPPNEMLATKPMMIMLMHGGMVSAITADAASTAAVSLGSWRVRRTAGTTIPPTAAISASLEPETPEKNAVARIAIRFIEH